MEPQDLPVWKITTLQVYNVRKKEARGGGPLGAPPGSTTGSGGTTRDSPRAPQLRILCVCPGGVMRPRAPPPGTGAPSPDERIQLSSTIYYRMRRIRIPYIHVDVRTS